MAETTCTNGTPVPLSGDIKPLTVPWLFQSLRTRSRTGTSFFDHVQGQTAEKVQKKVYFKNGDITFAASNLEADRLGDMLLRTGRLTHAQFDAASELIRKTGKKQGAILTQLGFITPQTLVDSVKEQVKQIVLSLFSVRMGTYRFEEGPLPVADIVPLQMSTGNLILEGITALEWNDIRRSLPSPTTVIRPVSDPSCLFQDAELSADQRTVFSLVDGKRSIEEICGLSGIGDFNALKAIYILLALRMAEEGLIKTEEEMTFAREAVREAVRATEEKKAAAPEERLREPELAVTRETIQQAFDALSGQDHYQVLGVERTATAQEIKKAYFRLAKAYHPDRHFDPTMSDLKGKLEALFDHLHKAYEALSDQMQRAEYDLAAMRRAPQPTPQEKAASEQAESSAEKAARARDQFNNGMKEFKLGNFWGAVESFTWATRLDPRKAQYFYYHGLCLTNIPRRRHEAEESLQKAIELDPDKTEYHIELSNMYLKGGLKPKALVVLNKALNGDVDVSRIKEAIAAAGEGKPTAVRREEPRPAAAQRRTVDPAKATQAKEQFTKGMKEFRTNNFGVAVEAFAEAAKLDPNNAQHFFYHGLCLTRIARRHAEAEEPLRRAYELDPSKMEHHAELGTFYLKAGQKAKSIGILKDALRRFPDAQKIKDALKAAAGAEPSDDEKKGGMFGKIFKK
jgi:tetratricopeptide (TPR) repeat protein